MNQTAHSSLHDESLTRRRFISLGARFGTGCVLAGGLASLAALCGCQGSPSEPSPPADSDSTEAPETEKAPPDHIIRAVFATDRFEPFPPSATSALSVSWGWHCLEGLYDVDRVTWETYPALAATAAEKIDERQWRVTLRENAAFSDGSPVRTSDVISCFDAYRSEPSFSFLLDAIEEMKAPDSTHIDITTSSSLEDGIEDLLSLVKVFCERDVTKEPADETASDALCGSGPWRPATAEELASIAGKEDLSGFLFAGSTANSSAGSPTPFGFVPNEYYNGPYPAKAPAMVWENSALLERRAELLIAKRADVAADLSLSKSSSLAKRLDETRATLSRLAGWSPTALAFRGDKAPFDSTAVRQALFSAINYDRIIARTLSGNAEPASSFLPSSAPAFRRASTVYRFDLDKARYLLNEAAPLLSHAGIKLVYENGDLMALAEGIAECWRLLEIDVELIPPEQLGDDEQGSSCDVLLFRAGSARYNANPLLTLALFYENPDWMDFCAWQETPAARQISQLLKQARRAKTRSHRDELCQAAIDVMADEAILYPLFFNDQLTGYDGSALEGFSPLQTDGLWFLTTSVR